MEYLLNNSLELLGLVTGIACVWLLIKENVLTFPIGLAYALITVVVVARANLLSDVVLNLYYVGMNAYGWYYWVRGGGERRQADQLAVGVVPAGQWQWLLLVIISGTLLMGWLTAQAGAELPYPDGFTTVASFVAMWMSARKYIESWLLWFVIDVAQVAIYLIKGIEPYALLYAIYLVMAVFGWLAWKPHVIRINRA